MGQNRCGGFAAQWQGLHVPSSPVHELRPLVASVGRDADVVVEAPMQARTSADVVAAHAEAGATWWLEQVLWLNDPEASPAGEEPMLRRIDEGPPRNG